VASDHPFLAGPLEGLGEVTRNLGRPAEARTYYARALQIREHRLGASHPELVPALRGLAEAHLAEGQNADAVPLAERALAICRSGPFPCLPEGQFLLARVLWANRPAAQATRRRALDLARTA